MAVGNKLTFKKELQMLHLIICFLGFIIGSVINTAGYAKEMGASSEELVSKFQHIRVLGCLIIAASLVYCISNLF